MIKLKYVSHGEVLRKFINKKWPINKRHEFYVHINRISDDRLVKAARDNGIKARRKGEEES